MRRLRVYPTARRAFQATTSPFEQWLGAGTTDLATSQARCFSTTNNVQTFTTTTGIDPPAGSRLVAVCRAGRGGHTAAYSWSFTASGGLGAMTVSWTGAEWPAAGNSFARQMAIAYVDVGGTPPTGVTVTVDAWATTDVGAYGVVLFCVSGFNAGSWLAQTPAETYSASGGSTSAAVALAAASTGQTYAATFAEDDLLVTTWGAPEAGWKWVAREVGSYYNSDLRVDATGDASGSTVFYWTPGSNNTATSVIFEIAPAAGGPIPINLAGTLTSAATVTRTPAQARAGVLGPAGALTRQARRAIPLGGASLPPAGALTRQTSRPLAGTLTSAATLTTIRAILRTFTAAIVSSATLTRSTARPLAGATTPAGQASRSTSKPLTGLVTSSAAVGLVRAILRAFTGSLGPAGALTRQTTKPVAGTAASSAAVARQTGKSLAGAVTSAGALTLAGAITSSAAVTRRAGKSLAAGVAAGGQLTRRPGKALAASITSGATLARTRVVVLALSGALAPAGAVARRTGKALAATLAPAGALTRQARKALGAVLAWTGAATVQTVNPEPWSWLIDDGAALNHAVAELNGQATTTDVTP
jgi:hypothetical protein